MGDGRASDDERRRLLGVAAGEVLADRRGRFAGILKAIALLD